MEHKHTYILVSNPCFYLALPQENSRCAIIWQTKAALLITQSLQC